MQATRSYEVIQVLGQGAFGTVYQAKMSGGSGFHKMVALKVLGNESDSVEIASRLRDEARILGMLRHRAIVVVDNLERLEGRWAVVMEFADGADLDVVLEKTGRMPVATCLDLVTEVAGGLHTARTTPGPDGRPLSLLHRDIKPANLRMTKRGEVKILDFGVARADFEAREAKTQQMGFGSMGYVATERIDGVDVAAGDIYSLGAVFYEMLAGQRFGQTFLKPERHAKRLEQRTGQLLAAGVPEGVVDLLSDMLAFHHDHRPNAREVERRASQLRVQADGDGLRDWCEKFLEQHVKPCTAPDTLGLVGRTLTPSEEPVELPAPQPARSGCGWLGWLALLLFLLVVVSGIAMFIAVGGVLVGRFAL